MFTRIILSIIDASLTMDDGVLFISGASSNSEVVIKGVLLISKV